MHIAYLLHCRFHTTVYGGFELQPSPQYRTHTTTTSISETKQWSSNSQTPNRFVLFTSGLINITLPHSSDFITLHHGRNAIIAAVDTTGTGHISTYPSEEVTVVYQLPFKEDVAPEYEVLGEGACEREILDDE